MSEWSILKLNRKIGNSTKNFPSLDILFDFYHYSPTTLARGVTSDFLTIISVMSTRAAAPSLRVLALAAVTVPPSSSLMKAGFRDENFSKLALWVGGGGDVVNSCA
jgi:hypothetical protein